MNDDEWDSVVGLVLYSWIALLISRNLTNDEILSQLSHLGWSVTIEAIAPVREKLEWPEPEKKISEV